jgi:hypothetical protein
MAVELASAYVSIIPTTKGIAAGLEKELGAPVAAAAKKAGDDAGKSLTSSFDKVGGGLTKFGGIATGMAAAAGTGLIKLAGNFEDLALHANKMSLATGLTVDAASRWIEVSGDLGVEADTVQSSLGKLNKAADLTPDKFAAIGAEVIRTKDGAVNVNATFLSTVDALNAMTDPAARQTAAAALLGKGWQGMAELIGEGSGKLKASLADVADAKVINPGEVQKAKDYRGDLDHLTDSIEELGLSIGQSAAPMIGHLADGIGTVVDLVGKANAVTGGAAGTFLTFATAGVGLVGTLSVVAGQAMKMKSRFVDSTGALNNMGKAAGIAGKALGLIGIAVAGLEILDKVTEDTHRASKAFDDLTVSLGSMGKSEAGPQVIIEKVAEMSHQMEASKGTSSKFFDGFKNGFHEVAINADDFREVFDKLSPDQANLVAGALAELRKQAIGGNEAATKLLDTEVGGAAAVDDIVSSFNSQTAAQKTLTAETDNGTAATDLSAAAQAELEKKVQATVDAMHAEADALLAKASAMRGAADDTFALADATDTYAKFEAELATKVKEAKGDQTDINALYREGTLNAASVADAVVKLSVDHATATGATYNATQQQTDWNREMLFAAEKATPAQRASIAGFIAEANNIPVSKVTDILAHTDDASFEQSATTLNELTAPSGSARQADVKAVALTAAAQTALDGLAAGPYTATLRVVVPNNWQGPLPSGTVITHPTDFPRVPKTAAGTSFWRGGLTWLAEEGPELVDLPRGSVVHNASDTRAIRASSASLMSAGGSGATGATRTGLNVEHLEVHNDVDADGFFRLANFHLAGV